MQPTVSLFDIDGTLISSGGAGKRAVDRAFALRHGRADACAGFTFAGMTDRAIVRAGLRAIGALTDEDAAERAIDELLELYLGFLAEEVGAATGYRVHPGIEAALERVLRTPRYAVGLGTGNVEHGARLKLSRADLHRRFAYGGFGSDAEDRAELLRIGAERGARLLGLPLAECRVVVIGDTPKDVAAARAIGADSIGVATGSFSAAELLGCGATHAFADLAAPGALDALLG